MYCIIGCFLDALIKDSDYGIAEVTYFSFLFIPRGSLKTWKLTPNLKKDIYMLLGLKGLLFSGKCFKSC